MTSFFGRQFSLADLLKSSRTGGYVLALGMGLLLCLGPNLQMEARAQEGSPISERALQDLGWRAIGPATVGGRVTSTAGVAGDPSTFYVASASGGLYRTTNGGNTFESIFTDQPVLSIGAVTVAPSNADVVYVGTGEGDPRNTVSFGNGVYRSTDGGETWTHLGLDNSERIAEIKVHPDNPDVVFVAAMGHEWGENEQRGLFRSTDGGETWEKVLYVNDRTGASDVAFDPGNPDIMYAGMYEYMRKPWRFDSGGEGSGLYRSADGGETWTELTAKAPQNGLPSGLLGRVGIAVAPSNPYVVYAMIESEANGELWRSDDRGKTWRMVSDNPEINDRPFYFTDPRVDPSDPDRIYALSGPLMLSTDGGESFERIAEGVHGDFQAMWIDPLNPSRVLVGSDGGIFASSDRTENFEFLNQMVLAQAYHVSVDMREPYYVCGGLQDNGVWCGPHEKYNTSGIQNRDWYRINGGDGYYAEIDPRDWTRIFTNSHYGEVKRFDAESGERQNIKPYPVSLRGSAAGDHPYRFNWNSPVHMSPNNPDVVYFGSNVLFKTTDGGSSWTEISPDLTKDEPGKQRSSGGITTDNTSAEYHNAILSISESPVDSTVIWVGTDDGNLQVTRNGGESWTNVVENVPNVPDHTWIPDVDASNHQAGTAYVVFDRHRQDDFTPRVYRTDDYGETWTDITANLSGPNYPHVIKDDPENPQVLYLGTELGAFVSFNRGQTWVSLQRDLPPVAVRDIAVHPRENDMILATHGSGFQVMEDITPLQNMGHAREEGVYLFDPPTGTRFEPWNDYIGTAQGEYVAENPPYGAVISYYLSPDQNENVRLEILNGDGEVIRELDAEDEPGVNRVYWDFRKDPYHEVQAESIWWEPVRSPKVLPGEYTVRLAAGGQQMTQPLTVDLDPRLDEVTEEDLQAQHDAVDRLARMAARGDRAMERLNSAIESLSARHQAANGALKEEVGAVKSQFAAYKDSLEADPGGYRSPAQLQDKVEDLLREIDSATEAPTQPQRRWIDRFSEDMEAFLSDINAAVNEDLAELNQQLQRQGLDPIDLDQEDGQ
jgi:photosystem II stability/assembly factor-like uncharacterized protein